MPPDLECGKMGSLLGFHLASSAVQHLKMPLTSFLHALCWKINVGSCLAPSPPQFWDMDLPHPAREPDSFACIMLGIDWIDDIEIQVFCINFLAELKAFRAELTQP